MDNLEFMELMQQVYHDGGYELLGYADQGFRVMTTNKKWRVLQILKDRRSVPWRILTIWISGKN